MAKLKHDATVGRILLMDVNNPPDLTAEEFLSYINEGFIPVSCGHTAHNTGYEFCVWNNSDGHGDITVSAEGVSITTFRSAFNTTSGSDSESSGEGPDAGVH